MKISDPTIVIDKREQLPLCFAAGVRVVPGTLGAGDYAPLGCENAAAIERKSLNDLVGSVIFQRARFERELQRLALLDFAVVVIEANILDVWEHRYVSRAVAQSVIGSIAAMHVDHNIPFIFCGDASRSADLVWRLLRRWYVNTKTKEAALTEVTP